MPLPGPPALKEPPPPMSVLSTVIAVEPFWSRQPPLNSKARMMFVSGESVLTR